MAVRFRKYWTDLIRPALHEGKIPLIPQAVVLRNGEVHLVKRDSPALWELPGGGILPGHTIEDALRSEVQEASGAPVEVIELLGWHARPAFRAPPSATYL